jgi:hypothetical protein
MIILYIGLATLCLFTIVSFGALMIIELLDDTNTNRGPRK